MTDEKDIPITYFYGTDLGDIWSKHSATFIWKYERSPKQEPIGRLSSSQLHIYFAVINIPHFFSHPHGYSGN